jgi:hypothetical protein
MSDLDAQMELSPRPSPEEVRSIVPTPTSDTTEAASKKRSTPDQSDGEPAAEHAAKRRRIEESGLQTPPAEDSMPAVLDNRPTFNHEPSHLLRRSTALVLEHVGFDGATEEALEELCGEAESCA